MPADTCGGGGRQSPAMRATVSSLALSLLLCLGLWRAAGADPGRCRCPDSRTMACCCANIASLQRTDFCRDRSQLLELNRNSLTEMPPLAGMLAGLIDLDVRLNRIRSVPEGSLDGLGLQSLDLQSNDLKRAEDVSLWGSTKLSRLFVSHNKLTSLSFLPEPCALEELAASHNELSNIDAVSKCSRLQKLNLQSNRITSLDNLTLPAGLDHLFLSSNLLPVLHISLPANLSSLDLSHNRLTEVTLDSAPGLNLESLRLAYNRLPHLPPGLSQLSSLRSISASHNRISGLNASSLPASLTDLDLSNNQLNSLPQNLAEICPDLQSLLVSSNQLGHLDRTTLPHGLRHLHLSHNKFTSLPEGVNKLDELQYLDASYNDLHTLSNISLSGVLKVLIVSGNHLTSLTADLGTLHAIHRLDVSHNELASIPPDAVPRYVETLQLQSNRLTFLPELSQFPQLTVVDASSNRLSELNGSLPPNLYELDVSGNQLRELPPGLGQLGELRNLLAADNQLSELPAAPDGAWRNLRSLSLPRNNIRAVDGVRLLALLGEGATADLRGNPLELELARLEAESGWQPGPGCCGRLRLGASWAQLCLPGCEPPPDADSAPDPDRNRHVGPGPGTKWLLSPASTLNESELDSGKPPSRPPPPHLPVGYISLLAASLALNAATLLAGCGLWGARRRRRHEAEPGPWLFQSSGSAGPGSVIPMAGSGP